MKANPKRYWCLNNCGKKVEFDQIQIEVDGRYATYMCSSCGQTLTKDQIKAVNNVPTRAYARIAPLPEGVDNDWESIKHVGAVQW